MGNFRKFGYISLFSTTAILGLFPVNNPANAACLPAAPYNNAANNIICNPGAGETFNTQGGNDTVTTTSGTVGTVTMGNGRDTFILNNGTVIRVNQNGGRDTFTMNGGSINIITQGGGADTLTINAGTVNTSINQGGGRDTLTISGGTVGNITQANGNDILNISGGTTGNINQGNNNDTLTISNGTTGAVVQGGGIDDFIMNAGATVTSLNQNAGFDTATINGGHIVGLFDNGDRVDFHGGRIGSVNIRAGNNIFIMDGTTGTVSIDTFLNAEQGTDTITLTAGTIGTSVNSGSNDDIITVGGTNIGTDLLTERGDDTITLSAGTIGGNVDAGDDNDNITLSGLSVVGNIIAGLGDDTFNWTAGTFASFNGGDGSDTANVSASEFNASHVLDGGDDTSSGDGFIDQLNITGVTVTLNGANIINWEIVSFASATATISDLVTETINVCGGSTTLSGATTANNVLGCVSNDTITITGNGVISNVVEGAGGNDTITISGNASITNGVFGGGAGQDASAASDGDDTININTTGTVLIVDGGQGNDTFNLLKGTVTTNILGQTGDDTFNWTAGTFTSFIGGDGSDTALITASEFNGSRVLDGGDDVSSGDGFVDTITFSGLNAAANGANIINWENVIIDDSTISFSNSALTAGTTTITNNGVLDAGNMLNLNSNLTINSTGIFDGTGSGAGIFNINGNLTNNGLIKMADGSTGDRVVVSNNYSGNGTVSLDTKLGNSNSKTDKLVIKGNSAGTTALNITNVGGTGANTGTSSTSGIKVVEVDGSSNGNFVLANNLTVGIYTYSLNKADNQNWYLQSGPQSQVYGYSVLRAIISKEVDTYWQRSGKQNQLVNRDGSISTNGSGFWMRSLYTNTTANAMTRFDTASLVSNLDYTRTFVQIGYDHRFMSGANGNLVGGIFGHYKNLKIGVSDGTGARLATTRSTGFGGGASLSWSGNGGFYADFVGQLTAWNNKITGANGASASPHAIAYSLSGEAGYKIPIDDFARLVPQAQLIWQDARINRFTDSAGLAVSWNNKGAITGRLGLGLELGKPVAQGGSGLSGYVIANLVRRFNQPGSANIANSTVSTRITNTYLEGRMGFNLKAPQKGLTFFTEAGFAHALYDHKYASFKGIAGVRVDLN